MQVAKEDFPSTMNWYDAMSACQNLGNGWRLPTREELMAMYEQLYKQGKGNFQRAYYWSSSQYDSRSAFGLNFYNRLVGNGHDRSKSNISQVRAVRALP